jgi:hypothetical protein
MVGPENLFEAMAKIRLPAELIALLDFDSESSCFETVSF